MNNHVKNFDILATSLSVLHILIVQQNYFSNMYPTKILDLSANRFFRALARMCVYLYLYFIFFILAFLLEKLVVLSCKHSIKEGEI